MSLDWREETVVLEETGFLTGEAIASWENIMSIADDGSRCVWMVRLRSGFCSMSWDRLR